MGSHENIGLYDHAVSQEPTNESAEGSLELWRILFTYIYIFVLKIHLSSISPRASIEENYRYVSSKRRTVSEERVPARFVR